jgi:hypothetical protein
MVFYLRPSPCLPCYRIGLDDCLPGRCRTHSAICCLIKNTLQSACLITLDEADRLTEKHESRGRNEEPQWWCQVPRAIRKAPGFMHGPSSLNVSMPDPPIRKYVCTVHVHVYTQSILLTCERAQYPERRIGLRGPTFRPCREGRMKSFKILVMEQHNRPPNGPTSPSVRLGRKGKKSCMYAFAPSLDHSLL